MQEYRRFATVKDSIKIPYESATTSVWTYPSQGARYSPNDQMACSKGHNMTTRASCLRTYNAYNTVHTAHTGHTAQSTYNTYNRSSVHPPTPWYMAQSDNPTVSSFECLWPYSTCDTYNAYSGRPGSGKKHHEHLQRFFPSLNPAVVLLVALFGKSTTKNK